MNDLVTRLQRIIFVERKRTKEILLLLLEIKEKEIYLELGYSNLFSFCTEHLGYSKGAASRRVNAVQLLKNVPEVVGKIENGELSLSTASQIQYYVKKTKNKHIAKSLVERLSKLSTREAEEEIERINLGLNNNEITITVSEKCAAGLQELRAMYSHQNLNFGAIVERIVEEKLLKVRANVDAPIRSAPNLEKLKSSERVNIPKVIREKIFAKAEGRCEYVYEPTKKRCNSKYFLQIDHIKPLSKGGTSEENNLRLLCAQHNKWMYRQLLGKQRI